MTWGNYQSPIGPLSIQEEGGKIVRVEFSLSNEPGSSPLISACIEELDQYFLGKRQSFSLPFEIRGTDFERRVYKALLTIPYGQKVSYKEIAQIVASPKAYRAVGMANHKNPLPILIPCHRVVAISGKLTGYSGGLDKKEYLLALEEKYR